MNKNKKINKEKTLALVLAGGLVTSTLNVVNTSADMIQDVNLVESVSTSNESVIPNQTLNFDKSKPSDITITGVKFNSKNLNSISITDENGKPQNIELSNVKKDESNGTITIPSNVISNLNLTVGVHAISLHFSDDSATIGAVLVNVIDSNSAVNPPKDDNTIVVPPVTPPSDDKNDKEDTITKKPTIEYQKLTFDMNNKQDKEIHDKLVNLVDSIIDLNKKLSSEKNPNTIEMLNTRIQAVDAAIDKIVYSLYNLTDEEIRVIEGE